MEMEAEVGGRVLVIPNRGYLSRFRGGPGFHNLENKKTYMITFNSISYGAHSVLNAQGIKH